MDYSSQLSQVKNLLPSAQSILIALPLNSNIDKLASGLALYLSLTQAGKSLSVFCPDTIKVGQSHLFAIDKVSQTIPTATGGDYSLTFKDVATNGVVSSLEKLDYSVLGNDLVLVFKSLPGQTFQPQNIIPGNSGGSFNLIFVIGASNLNELTQNVSGAHLVNIDNNQANTNFGQTNIVDPNAASISEMVVSIISSLVLPFDADMASNLIAGIFEATSNLTSDKGNAETFMAMANCLRVGGRKPQAPSGFSATGGPASGWDLSALMPPQPASQQVSGSVSQQQPTEAFVNPTIVGQPTPSPEERPSFEQVVSESEAEPDWLTPKIFKGSSIG